MACTQPAIPIGAISNRREVLMLLGVLGACALLPRSTPLSPTPTTYRAVLGRREWLFGGAALLAVPGQARAAAAEAFVTDRVLLEFVQQVGPEESLSLPITVGLYGKEAPQSVAAFKALVKGGLQAPCKEDTEEPGAMDVERAQRTRKAQFRQCVAGEAEPVTYDGSAVWRIVRGERVDAGAVRGKFALRQPPLTPTSESAALSHDAPGLLSVRRGGGTFDFGLTTAADPVQDGEYIVIGRVLQGLDAVAAMDRMPVVKAAEMMGQGSGATASREKSCAYGSANTYCSQNKPLKKLTLLRASLL